MSQNVSSMHTRFLVLCVAALFATTYPPALGAQADSDVLFTVDGEPVTVGEFRYIYAKTNGEAADFSDESVREYLDLYERFKLKVARARQMGLDTVTALQQELAGYRKQLADNYLIDRRVTDKLVTELYARQAEDIEIHHILFGFNGTPRPADTARLYQQALEVKKQTTTQNFAQQAALFSSDKYSKEKGGRIGFVTAPFPKGMAPLEAALYDAPKNTIVGPVRTALGYHLAMKSAARPARGEVEIAHILIRKSEERTDAEARAKAEQARAALNSGTAFEQVAAQYSEDDDTKNDGGYIGFFGINRYAPAFEDAAFALTADGQVSEIIESPVGFHLLRRISRRERQPLAEVRPLLENKVKADPRFAAAQEAMLRDIRRNYGMTERKQEFGRYAATLQDSTFFDFRWEPMGVKSATPVLEGEGNFKRTIVDFQNYLEDNARRRVALRRNNNAYGAAEQLYNAWVDEQLLAYAESRLEIDFPEFAALMREYREGILLFEATKLEVWDKASADSVGLAAYFEANQDKYQYGPRARVTYYAVDNGSGLNPTEVASFAAKNTPEAVKQKFGAGITTSEELIEEGRLTELDGSLSMRMGSLSAITSDLRRGQSSFRKVEEILPARPKELNEARGYVIADYQDALERAWVEQLRQEFPVKRNKKVLGQLTKSR